uniref:Mannosyltransferase n=1 Tax=Ciona savignyi TaxID=51511 RepID=H2YHV1_CIOSA
MENWWLKMIWVHCAALRYMLCILPQTGYIFPDEFFQSPEIMAGDLLDIASYRTWEWDSSKPARNIVFPLVSSGIPYMVMRYLSGIFGSQNIITPYTLLLGPRLWMTTLSFVVDYLIYRLAVKCYNGNTVVADVAVNLFATSYTCWVFCTRTFSNTAELLLLAILLNLVVIPIGKEHNVKNIFDMNAKATLVALTTMAAFFIRTSFIAFALFPIGMWVFQNVSFSNNPREMVDTFLRVFALYPGFVIAAVGFAFCDGIYFNHNSTQMFPLNSLSLHNVSRWITELPWTPINILKYNFNDSLLEQHGKHPY